MSSLIDGKQTAISTGVFYSPEDWNSKKGEIRDNKSNELLTKFRNRINQTYDSILKEEGVIRKK